MKKIVLTSLMMVCLPFLAVAQSVEDDLYFIPKKKAEKKEEVKQEVKVAVPQKQNNTTVYAAPGSTVVVKDVKGNMRDVDEYNRRYTSRDNTFSMENDTLYIEEKPLNERGEWVNGFEGSQDDYEYAMRIVRFRNPRYAIPVSSPLYWDVVYGLPSWDWNVYDDGLYAYVFPTYTNRLWWDWRFNYLYGPGWTVSTLVLVIISSAIFFLPFVSDFSNQTENAGASAPRVDNYLYNHFFARMASTPSGRGRSARRFSAAGDSSER